MYNVICYNSSLSVFTLYNIYKLKKRKLFVAPINNCTSFSE